MKTKSLFLVLIMAFMVVNARAQTNVIVVKTDGTVLYQSSVSKIDKVIFYDPTGVIPPVSSNDVLQICMANSDPEVSLKIDDIEELLLSNVDLTVKKKDTSESQYSIENIDKLNFGIYVSTGIQEPSVEKVNVFASNGLIRITSGESNPIKEAAVYNLQGVLLYKTSAINTTSYTINANWPAGVYIVEVVSENGVNNVKISKS